MKKVNGPRPRRLALLTWAVAWPLITVLLFVLNPLIGHWPMLVRTFLLSGAMVGGLSFVLLPPLRQRFHNWLHAQPRQLAGKAECPREEAVCAGS